MKRLSEMKLDFGKGLIEKEDFISHMHDHHKILFDYAEIIGDTDIDKIEITDNKVVLVTKENEIKLICDKFDKRTIPYEIMNFGSYEKEDMSVFCSLIKEGDTVFDIGANIGWYSINLSKRIKNVKVHSFEPVEKTFDYLKKNIELNNCSEVRCYNFGFLNEEKEIDIFYNPESSVSASLRNLSGKEVNKVPCKFYKLSDFVTQNNLKIDVIKCDVEGAELFVFEGGLEALEAQKPIIFTEMLRKWSAKFSYHPNDIIKILKNIGYNCYVINQGKLIEFNIVTEESAETNYFFIHQTSNIKK